MVNDAKEMGRGVATRSMGTDMSRSKHSIKTCGTKKLFLKIYICCVKKYNKLLRFVNVSNNMEMMNFRFSPCIIIVNNFYCPTNALNYTKLRG